MSVYWVGYVRPWITGTYTFAGLMWRGDNLNVMRVYINGTRYSLTSPSGALGATLWTGGASMRLVQSVDYRIKVEYEVLSNGDCELLNCAYCTICRSNPC